MGIGIHCCKNCVPPKRTRTCHATCEEYLKEKAQFEEDKQKVKQDMQRTPNLKAYDFDVNAFSKTRRRKH